MTKSWQLVHNGIFAGSMLLLGLFAVWRVGSQQPAPDAVPVDAAPGAGVINGELAKSFESHYDEVFPAKTFGVNLWAALELGLFGDGREGVRVGANDWLYTAEEFRAPPNAEAQILRHLALITWVRDELARRDAALVVALVPAKRRIYPENVGRHRPAQIHERLYPLVRESLLGLRVTAPDLVMPLLACRKQAAVFLRTDTHWTSIGARCAAQGVARGARTAGAAVQHPAAYHTQTGAEQAHRGDLFNFLPLDPYFAWLLPPAETLTPQHTVSGASMYGNGDALLDERPAPRVALVGTSYSADRRWNFTGALQESLGEDVVNYSSEGSGPFLPMLQYLHGEEIEQAPPRLVIWEIPERYLPMGEDLSAYQLPGLDVEATKGDTL